MSERPPLPDSISGCVLESKLREGPAVVVMRGRDSLGLPVDVHLFQADLVTARFPKEVFFDEVRASAGIQHERLATVVNAGEKGPWLFVVCRGTQGATLAHLLARGHLDEERALAIFAAAAEGLATLEKAGLCHGGLDPRVVGLPGAGQVLLGLRRLVPEDLSARDPSYLSPEEARGQEWGTASDLFTLGLMMLEGLLGRPAFDGTPEEIRIRLARGSVPVPAEALKGVHPQTVEILGALLSADPRARPPSAAETARRFRQLQAAFMATEALEIPPTSPLPPPAPGSWAAPPPAAAPAAAPPAAPPVLAPVSVPPAPPAAPAAPPPQAPAPPPAAVAAAQAFRGRRAQARLVLAHKGDEFIHELLDPTTWIGLNENARLVARPEPFPGAVARIETGAQGDVLTATGTAPAPAVRGQEVLSQALGFGDEIRVGHHRAVYERAERLLPEGAEGTDQERAHRARRRPSKAPFVVGLALCLAVGAWGVLRIMAAANIREDERFTQDSRARELERKFATMPNPGTPPTAAERASREEAAFRLLDYAREERTLGKSKTAQEKYESILRQYPDSGAALLAQDELREIRGAARLPGADELRSTQAKADALAAEGRHAEAQDLLLKFASDHSGTYVGDRAAQAAAALAKITEDRVDELLRAARAAADRKDWQAAVEAVNRAVASSAPGDVLDRARVEQARIQKLLPRSAPEGPRTPPPEAKAPAPPPERKPPAPEPPPAGKPAPPAGRDEEAAEIFRDAREALEAGRFGEAERGFYSLLAKHPEAKIVREYGTEIRQRIADAAKKGHGVAGLFRGGIQFRGGRVSLTYEFENAAEAEDWELVHPFAVPNRGRFTLENGELAGDGAAAFMMRAGFRPESVLVSFRIRPGIPAQDMGVMMAETKDLANHLLFAIGNEFFRIGKGAKAEAVPGNVIWVFGKGMWRDTDPGMIGFVRTAASEEPKVQPRKWTEVEALKDRDKARFTLDGKAIHGRAVGDNKYELTGIRPALFVLLSEARFDEVTVEGELDPAWVVAERERVFPEPR